MIGTALKSLIWVICLGLATPLVAQDDPLAQTLRDSVTIPLSQLPGHVPAALVAAEDRSFYDIPAWKSPITAHLARLTLEEPKASQGVHRIQRSFELAELLDHRGILEVYLNKAFYGRDAFGITAAAQAYFGKPAADLSPSEAVYLAMLLKAPLLIPTQAAEDQARRYDFVRKAVLDLKVLDMRDTTHLTLSSIPSPLPD